MASRPWARPTTVLGSSCHFETLMGISLRYWRSTAQPKNQRLRPLTDIESCECASVNGILLVDLLTDNPLHCDFCRKEVDPERLQLTVEETEAVARWFSAADSLYRLWLDSGEY